MVEYYADCADCGAVIEHHSTKGWQHVPGEPILVHTVLMAAEPAKGTMRPTKNGPPMREGNSPVTGRAYND